MKKRNIVIINVYLPPDSPTEKFSSPLNDLRTKLLEIGNPMPNIFLLLLLKEVGNARLGESD